MSSHARRVARHILRHAKDHFIPHDGNGHHPHVLKHRVLLGYSLILVLLKALTIAGSIALPSWSTQASAITPENIFTLTNEARQHLKLPPLTVNSQLAIAARAKAEDMAVNHYFAHTSPAGVTPWTWIKNTGYRYRVSAENLAVHFQEVEDVQSGWMASPSHRANIVDPRFTETGIGIAIGDYEGVPSTFVVQYFAVPKLIDTAPTTTSAPILATAAPTSSTSIEQTFVPAEEEIPAPDATPTQPPEPRIAVTPKQNGYTVQLTSNTIAKATAHVGGVTAELQPGVATTSWTGSITVPPGSIAPGGEPLYLTLEEVNGSSTFAPIATVAPASPIVDVFGQPNAPEPELKLFGFITLRGLNDVAHKSYVFFVLFLATCLLLNILIKFQSQRVSVVAHGTLVLILGIILSRV